MKKSNLWINVVLIFSILFFIVVNTQYLLEFNRWYGMLSFLIMLFLVGIYGIIALLFVIQVFISISENFKRRRRIITIIVMTIVLITTYIYPRGMIDYRTFEAKDKIVGYRDGHANCGITMKLKENQRFIITEVCFGISKHTGRYVIKEDSVLFYYDKDKREGIEYAIIETPEYLEQKYGPKVNKGKYGWILTYVYGSSEPCLYFKIVEKN